MKVAFFFEFTEVGIQLPCRGYVYNTFGQKCPFKYSLTQLPHNQLTESDQKGFHETNH